MFHHVYLFTKKKKRFSDGTFVCTLLNSDYVWFVDLIVHWFPSKSMLAFWLNTVQIKVGVIGCTCTHSKAGFRIKKNITTTIISILIIITVQIMQFIWHFRFSAAAAPAAPAAHIYKHKHKHALPFIVHLCYNQRVISTPFTIAARQSPQSCHPLTTFLSFLSFWLFVCFPQFIVSNRLYL